MAGKPVQRLHQTGIALFRCIDAGDGRIICSPEDPVPSPDGGGIIRSVAGYRYALLLLMVLSVTPMAAFLSARLNAISVTGRITAFTRFEWLWKR
ncbi:TPA: hypothetical protein O7139_005552 [Salmonella enterica]|nr:hypothetical protein [Salmonella enterica]HDC2563403.1 hypothetical protein [Salmonella enterica]